MGKIKTSKQLLKFAIKNAYRKSLLKAKKLKKLEDINSNKKVEEEITKKQKIDEIHSDQQLLQKGVDDKNQVEVDKSKVGKEADLQCDKNDLEFLEKGKNEVGQESNLQSDDKEIGVDEKAEKGKCKEEQKSNKLSDEKFNLDETDQNELHKMKLFPEKKSTVNELMSLMEPITCNAKEDQLPNLEFVKNNEKKELNTNLEMDTIQDQKSNLEYVETNYIGGRELNCGTKNKQPTDDQFSNLESVKNNENELNLEAEKNKDKESKMESAENNDNEMSLETDENKVHEVLEPNVEESDEDDDEYDEVQVDAEISFRISRKRKRSDDSINDNSNCKRRKINCVKFHQMEPKVELELLSDSNSETEDEKTQMNISINDSTGDDLLMHLFNRECHQFLENVFLTLTKSEMQTCQNVSSEWSSLVTFYCGPKVSQIERVLARHFRNREWKADFFPEMDALPDDKTLEEYFIEICRPEKRHN